MRHLCTVDINRPNKSSRVGGSSESGSQATLGLSLMQLDDEASEASGDDGSDLMMVPLRVSCRIFTEWVL